MNHLYFRGAAPLKYKWFAVGLKKCHQPRIIKFMATLKKSLILEKTLNNDSYVVYHFIQISLVWSRDKFTRKIKKIKGFVFDLIFELKTLFFSTIL